MQPSADVAAGGRREAQPISLWQAAWRRLLRKPLVIASLAWILLMIGVAVLAQKLAPYSYQFQDLQNARVDPFTPGHFLGTDELGRDILSRLIYGARVSMSVSFGVSAIGVSLGIILGLLAGYLGGWVDQIVMRLTDFTFAFPDLLLAILIMGIRGQGLENMFLALGVVAWPGTCRLVRGLTLASRHLEYVEGARALGQTTRQIMFRHILPNILSPIIVSASLGLGGLILAEATLSFLGIGVRPPFPSWGAMVYNLLGVIWSQPVLLLFPCVVLGITVLAFNLLGDGLRDALDPRLKQ